MQINSSNLTKNIKPQINKQTLEKLKNKLKESGKPIQDVTNNSSLNSINKSQSSSSTRKKSKIETSAQSDNEKVKKSEAQNPQNKIKDPPITEAIKKSKKIIDRLKNSSVPQKGIYFINGMFISSLSSNRTGMRNLAESFEGARYYSWDDKELIMNHISKLKDNSPIILVGHSLGGDTAVEIAQELNSLKKGFKKVDLLVTIDSFGLDNDIIPTNVKKNLNYFGEKDFFLNDTPNIARNVKETLVENYLRPEHHTELDNSQPIQSQIVQNINEVLNS